MSSEHTTGIQTEINLWMEQVETQFSGVDENDIVLNIVSKKEGSLGSKVSNQIIEEIRNLPTDHLSLGSVLLSSIVIMYMQEAPLALLDAEEMIKKGEPTRDPTPLVKDEIDEAIEELLAPADENEALQDSIASWLKGKSYEELLLKTLHPKVFIDELTDQRVTFFNGLKGSEIDLDMLFHDEVTLKGFEITRARFHLVYDRAETLEKSQK